MTFTDWLISLGERGEVVGVGPDRLIFLAPSGGPSPVGAAPAVSPGRGTGLSRSVCASCETESLATAPELLNHRCIEEGT